jgi:hypothetical protein
MTEPLLLDEFLPTYDHVISISEVFRAPPEEVFEVITNLDLFDIPVARVLLEARGLPARLIESVARRRGAAVAPEPPTFRVRDLPERGWMLLGERPGAEVVYGNVGKAWRAAGGAPEHQVTAEEFAGFAEPGFAKLAESLRVAPYGAHACVLTQETRVATTDEDSRRRFRRYWLAVGPFIHLIRPAVMRALARELKRPPSTAG